MIKRCLLGLTILIVIVGSLCLLTSYHESQVMAHLKAMPDNELFQLFLENDMRIHEDFQQSFTDQEIIELFKKQFDHIIETGHPRVLSHLGHKEMGDDILSILNKLLNN